eukprot:TRINITY_DN4504_c0_g1_i1.p1 TRINITY_DN4504_c0_g1~~TRINITY_DN4504_c0_g1_i1.p1  ORF type:complete len:1699 (+),score=254.72 TRINITY_DN4504_c0_g1_i1:35-5131(+)
MSIQRSTETHARQALDTFCFFFECAYRTEFMKNLRVSETPNDLVPFDWTVLQQDQLRFEPRFAGKHKQFEAKLVRPWTSRWFVLNSDWSMDIFTEENGKSMKRSHIYGATVNADARAAIEARPHAADELKFLETRDVIEIDAYDDRTYFAFSSPEDRQTWAALYSNAAASAWMCSKAKRGADERLLFAAVTNAIRSTRAHLSFWGHYTKPLLDPASTLRCLLGPYAAAKLLDEKQSILSPPGRPPPASKHQFDQVLLTVLNSFPGFQSRLKDILHSVQAASPAQVASLLDIYNRTKQKLARDMQGDLATISIDLPMIFTVLSPMLATASHHLTEAIGVRINALLRANEGPGTVSVDKWTAWVNACYEEVEYGLIMAKGGSGAALQKLIKAAKRKTPLAAPYDTVGGEFTRMFAAILGLTIPLQTLLRTVGASLNVPPMPEHVVIQELVDVYHQLAYDVINTLDKAYRTESGVTLSHVRQVFENIKQKVQTLAPAIECGAFCTAVQVISIPHIGAAVSRLVAGNYNLETYFLALPPALADATPLANSALSTNQLIVEAINEYVSSVAQQYFTTHRAEEARKPSPAPWDRPESPVNAPSPAPVLPNPPADTKGKASPPPSASSVDARSEEGYWRQEVESKQQVLQFLQGQIMRLSQHVQSLEPLEGAFGHCCPDVAVARLHRILKIARRARRVFTHRVIVYPASDPLAKVLEDFSRPQLPTTGGLREAQEAFEQLQWKIRQLPLRNKLTGENGTDPAVVSALVLERDNARKKLIEISEAFVQAVIKAELNKLLSDIETDRLPHLCSLLGLFRDIEFTHVEKGAEDRCISETVAALEAFYTKSKSHAQEHANRTKTAVQALGTSLRESTRLLSDPETQFDAGSTDEAFQKAESEAFAEISWLFRHDERSCELLSPLVTAGYSLRKILEQTAASCRALLQMSEQYKSLAEQLRTSQRPQLEAYHSTDTAVKDSRIANVKYRAHLEEERIRNEKPIAPGMAQQAISLQETMQKSIGEHEALLAVMRVAAVTHFPELPQLYPDADIDFANTDLLSRPLRALDDYVELRRILGKRNVVIVARFNAQDCVLKEYNVEQTARFAFRNELLIASRLSHPNIIPVEAVVADFKRQRMHVHLPYYPMGSLSDWLDRHRDDEEGNAATLRAFAGHIIRGLAYMHSKGVVHGAVDLGNVLLEATGENPGIRAVIGLRSVATFPPSNPVFSESTNSTVTPSAVLAAACPHPAPSLAADVWRYACLLAGIYIPNFTPTNLAPVGSLDDATLQALLQSLFQRDAPAIAHGLEKHEFFADSSRQDSAQPTGTQWERITATTTYMLELHKHSTDFVAARSAHLAQRRQLWNAGEQLGSDTAALLEKREKLGFSDIVERLKVDSTEASIHQRWDSHWLQIKDVSSAGEDLRTNHIQTLTGVRETESELRTLVAHTEEAHTHQPPLHWQYWQKDNSQFGQQLVDISGLALQTISELFVAAWAEDTHTDEGAPRSLPKVMRVERVENADHWQLFSQHRTALHNARYSVWQDTLAATSGTYPEPTLLTDQRDWFGDLRDSGIFAPINEKLLFRAEPSREAAVTDCASQLRWGSLEGGAAQPILFSETLNAAVATTQDSQGLRYVLLCRVCLGFCTESKENELPALAPPRYRPKTDEVRDGIDLSALPRCDSLRLVGTSGSQFAIYDTAQCYPNFLIAYKLE